MQLYYSGHFNTCTFWKMPLHNKRHRRHLGFKNAQIVQWCAGYVGHKHYRIPIRKIKFNPKTRLVKVFARNGRWFTCYAPL